MADVGDLSDVVDSDDNGYLVRPNDVEAYVTHVETILRDPALWTRLSARASELAHRNYSVEAVAARWRRCFEDLLGRDAVRVAVDV